MADWELWIGMARESQEAAEILSGQGRLRDAASRFYYAAYQATTALLHYRGLTPPQGREAWSHDDTPDLVLSQLAPVLASRDVRRRVARMLRGLYELRVRADYHASADVNADALVVARRESGYVVSEARKILPTT